MQKIKIDHVQVDDGCVTIAFWFPGYVSAEALGVFANNMVEMRFVRPENWEPNPEQEITDPEKQIGSTFFLCKLEMTKSDEKPRDTFEIPDGV